MAKYQAQITITDSDGKTVIGKVIKPVQLEYEPHLDIYRFYVTNASYGISGNVWRAINGTESD